MANNLTGDFDFVVEVSDATLDRLAATMHQNGFSSPATPSPPHLAYFRIGLRRILPCGSAIGSRSTRLTRARH
jgi:hypothetical protein